MYQSSFIVDLISKHKYEFYLYDENTFQLRLKEEKIRSDSFKSQFAYIELEFNKVCASGTATPIKKDIWKIIFNLLSESVRGSDVKGYLPEKSGIGVIMLDSTDRAIRRFRNRIIEQLYSHNLLMYLVDKNSFLNGYIYESHKSEDTDIRDSEESESSE